MASPLRALTSVLVPRHLRFRRLAAAAILAICIGGPLVEIFDQWDHTAQDGNDTEINAIVAALCVGVAMAIGTAVGVTQISAWASSIRRRQTVARRAIVNTCAPGICPIPTSSPPTLLRI
jgi:hypothetical protein